MTVEKERDAAARALNIAFYALAHQLEQLGVIDQDALADEIARFDPGDRPICRANLEAIIYSLRTRAYSPRVIALSVIAGGKPEA